MLLLTRLIRSSVKTKLTLSKLNASTKELWASVNKVRNPLHVTSSPNILHSQDIVNSFFAKVASKLITIHMNLISLSVVMMGAMSL